MCPGLLCGPPWGSSCGGMLVFLQWWKKLGSLTVRQRDPQHRSWPLVLAHTSTQKEEGLLNHLGGIGKSPAFVSLDLPFVPWGWWHEDVERRAEYKVDLQVFFSPPAK